MRRIIIYGLGKRGIQNAEDMINHAEILRIRVVALMDKEKSGKEYDYPVYRPEMLKQLEYDYIAVTSVKWYQDIKEELHSKYGIENDRIILWRELLLMDGIPSRFYCNTCKKHVPYMNRTGHESVLFENIKVAGAGSRNHAICPYCGSVDRNRWVDYIIENKTAIYLDTEARILHFAPEDIIEHKLRGSHKNYISADIQPIADIIEDITAISFGDHEFDYIICNHVMQDVQDEMKAFSELKRCLKEKGIIIFSVPICWDLDTYEDEKINSPEGRLKAYGQEEHVRLYGKDLEKRLKMFGFVVKGYHVERELKKKQIEEMSLLPKDTVWILKNDTV